MSIKKLIEGQTIGIDNHHRGGIFEWGKGVHLHKRMNNNKYDGAEVLIPIAEDGELEFRKIKGPSKEIEAQMRNEIEKAFKKPSVKRSFINSFYKSLDDILKNEGRSIEDKIEILKTSASRIAKYFGLKPVIKDYFGEVADKFYVQFSRSQSSDFYVLTDVKRQMFVIGVDKNSIDDLYKYKMKEKKISIADLEECLSDGGTIDEILGSDYNCLRVDELNRSYNRDEDAELNKDMRDYLNTLYNRESRENWI